MEPRNKKSAQWRGWFVRHNFGASTVEIIKAVKIEELEVLRKFISDTVEMKKKCC